MKRLHTIAFIGLGPMGRPMAAPFAAAGYPLRVFDKSVRARRTRQIWRVAERDLPAGCDHTEI